MRGSVIDDILSVDFCWPPCSIYHFAKGSVRARCLQVMECVIASEAELYETVTYHGSQYCSAAPHFC